jgi:hypothetical protein
MVERDSLACGGWKEETEEMPPIKRNVDRYAIQEALRDLETSIEAYLVEWRRELGIQRVPEISTDLKALRLEAIERKEKR